VAGADTALYRFLQTTASRFVITQIYRETSQASGLARHLDIPLLPPALFDLRVNDPRMNARIYELKQPLPRAYLSNGWQVLSRDELLTRIVQAQSNGFDPYTTTLLEEKPVELKDESPAAPCTPVALKQYEPEEIEVQLQTDRPALLVLCDQWYPGWVARIDGQHTPILRCNGFMKAVAVPSSGKHTVRFYYHPQSMLGAVGLAAAGFVWLTLLALRAWL
jgi:hypothetical protein